jgi:uncharacterized repeat protein (TIGR03803 family)
MKNIYLLISVSFLLGTGTARAQFSVLHNFNDTAGSFPISSLTYGGGVLYGITGSGGDTPCNCGIIFSINANGTGYKDMHDFGGISDIDGNAPVGKLALAGNRLYGMTGNGMATTGGNDCTTCGMIFSINTDGSGYRKLYNFGDDPVLNCYNGCMPSGSFTLSDSILYGMANGGPTGDGAIFFTDTSGTVYDTLMTFNGTNGSSPSGALTLSGTRLYGMTTLGGANNLGCIFAINTNGSGFDTLMSFNGANGSKPLGSLTISGNVLYGMTEYGDTLNSGNIFSIHTDGTGYRDLHDFTNSENPQGDLTLSGNLLYGMTTGGGANLYGYVFSIDTNGNNFNTIFNFCGSSCNDTTGYAPESGLTLSGNVLYGMTYAGGTHGDGIIFKLDTNTTTSIHEVTATPGGINLYPNPTDGKFTLTLTQPAAIIATQPRLEIYNELGEMVYQSNITTGYSQINLPNPAKGVYLYRMVTMDSIPVGEGKFVVE